MRPILAILATGLLFGLGHFYMMGYGAIAYGIFLLSSMTISVLFGGTGQNRGPKERLLFATSLHFLSNLAIFFLFGSKIEHPAWLLYCILAIVLTLFIRRVPLFAKPDARRDEFGS